MAGSISYEVPYYAFHSSLLGPNIPSTLFSNTPQCYLPPFKSDVYEDIIQYFSQNQMISFLEVIQRYQNKILKSIVNAPWYV
jgi:hypothetical protein